MTQLNPAVRKLAEQAKGFVDLNQHVGGGNGCMIYTYEGLNQFAGLIVEECIACCGSQADMKNIRKRFCLPIESDIKYPRPEAQAHHSQYGRKYDKP
jgi:hypothetical protein